MEFHVQSCVRGFHVYGEHWTAFVGEELTCQREIGNVADRYAVAVEKATGETVGDVPKKISRICSSFLQCCGTITAIVTGRRRYSSDLVQGGLEIPCNLRFYGEEKLILKIKKVFKVKKCLKDLLSQ